MPRYSFLMVLITLMLYAGIASAQDSYPLMNKIAQQVIQKYQTSSCEELAMQKQNSQPPTKAVEMLRNDPKLRTAFLNQVAAPIANKMFECGMIP
ncbi:MAG: hypothetical protein ACREOP_15920 [Thermodesulfobacteriota bacterium]